MPRATESRATASRATEPTLEEFPAEFARPPEEIGPGIGESLKEGAKVGAFIASIAILSLSIYAIAVPAAIPTIAAILINIAKLFWAPTLCALAFGLEPHKGSLSILSWPHSIGFMLIIAAAAVAMSSILSLTALPVIGSVAPLVAPIILTVISASILITMSVKYGQHRFKIYKEEQASKQRQGSPNTGPNAAADTPHFTNRDIECVQRGKTPQTAQQIQPPKQGSDKPLLEGITRTRSASASSQQGEASEDSLSQPNAPN